jgi:hypothetical protein
MLLKFHSSYTMKVIALSAALLFACIYSHGQNLIGYKGKDILKYMKENYSDMNYNNVVNSKFSYLKFTDNLESQTMLFFLTPDSVCKSVRIICETYMKSEKTKELDSQYTKCGVNKWIDKRDSKEYIIKMIDGKWSCTISIENNK